MSEKKEQQNSDNENKNKEEELIPHVQSANKWETADLGETERKSKFLRLMGAAKKEHHGKFVIGDQKPNEERKLTDEHRLTEDLEVQFVQGLEHQRIGGRRGHIGLGYHNASKDSQEKQDSTETKTEETSEENVQETSESKKEEEETDEKNSKTVDVEEKKDERKDNDELGPSSAKKYKMAFVKASS